MKHTNKIYKSKKLYLLLIIVFVLASTSISCSKHSKTEKVDDKANVTTEKNNSKSEEKPSTSSESTTSSDAKTDTAANDSKGNTSSTSNTANTQTKSTTSPNSNVKSTTNKNNNASAIKSTTNMNNSASVAKSTTNSNSNINSISNTIGTSTTNTKSTNTTPTPAPSTPTPVPASSPAPASANYTYGNTSSNIINWGYAAYDENSIYYDDNNELYRANLNGSNTSKISSSNGSSYNIIGDWIYYTNGNIFDDSGIFKIKKGGSSKTKISNDSPFFICVVNDWIYYQVNLDGCLRLYKIKTDGTSKTDLDFSMNKTLVNIDYPELVVVDNWIYLDLYNTSNHTHGLYRVAADGSSVQSVAAGSCSKFVIDGNYLYYIKSGYRDIVRCNLDGSNPITIYTTSSEEFGIYSINISNGYIYFSSDSQSSTKQYQGIYKIKIDGSNFVKLSNINTKYICVVSNWIYFDGTMNDNRSIMKMKTDGTQISNIN